MPPPFPVASPSSSDRIAPQPWQLWRCLRLGGEDDDQAPASEQHLPLKPSGDGANVMLTRYKGQLKLEDWAFDPFAALSRNVRCLRAP